MANIERVYPCGTKIQATGLSAWGAYMELGKNKACPVHGSQCTKGASNE